MDVYLINVVFDGVVCFMNCIDDWVEGVIDDVVDLLYFCIEELLDELFGNIYERDFCSIDDMG